MPQAKTHKAKLQYMLSEHDKVAGQIWPGSRVQSRKQLTGGVSANTELLILSSDEGQTRQIVLRTPKGVDFKTSPNASTRVQFEVQTELAKLGFPVPKPLWFGEMDAGPCMAMEFVEGSAELESLELEDATSKMAAFLARLHQADASLLESVLPAGDDPITGSLRFLPDSPQTLELRQAIGRLQMSTSPRAILHGDFWPGNMLWRGGELAAVIDWEDAALGDPLSDLACARLELLCAHGPSATEHFTNTYLQLDPIPTDALPLWEIYVSSAALHSMSDWGLPPDAETKRRTTTTHFLHTATTKLLNHVE